MSDRAEQARAEAERQIRVYGDDFKARTLRANLNDAFVQGVEWADANPKPLDGKTVDDAWWQATEGGTRAASLNHFLRVLGIEVEDDDE